MNAAEILGKILEYKKLNAKAFSEFIGLDRPQAIYDIQKGKTKSISQSMANKISSVFPDINRVWLLTGEGDMLKNGNSHTYAEKSSVSEEPLEDYHSYASGSGVTPDLLNNISRMIQTNERNSISISKMVDAADRDSRTIAQLVDILYQNGISIPDKLAEKGGLHKDKNADSSPSQKDRNKNAG